MAYWVFELGYRLFKYLKPDFFQIAEKDSDNEYLYVIFLTFADLLAFFGLFFHIKCKKQAEYKNKINTKDKKTYFTFFGIFLLDLIARFSYFIFHKSFEISNEELSQKIAHDVIILIDIGFRFIFYLVIINGEVHRHKVCSAFSVIFIFLFLIILDFVNLDFKGKYDINSNLIYFGVLLPRAILFPFVDTVNKKLMIDKNILPFQLMRYRSIIELFYLSIITTILIVTNNLHFTSDIFSTKLAIAAPIYIISCFIKAILLLNVIYNFSSQSVSFLIISESFAGSFHEIINFFNNEENMSHISNIIISTIEIILVILIAIATLINEEIIIINKCGLEKNVREAIIERGYLDELSVSSSLDKTIYYPIMDANNIN